jgi:hypothetical protein
MASDLRLVRRLHYFPTQCKHVMHVTPLPSFDLLRRCALLVARPSTGRSARFCSSVIHKSVIFSRHSAPPHCSNSIFIRHRQNPCTHHRGRLVGRLGTSYSELVGMGWCRIGIRRSKGMDWIALLALMSTSVAVVHVAIQACEFWIRRGGWID